VAPTTPATLLGTGLSLILLGFLLHRLMSALNFNHGISIGVRLWSTSWSNLGTTLPAMSLNAIGSEGIWSFPCHMLSPSLMDMGSSQPSSSMTRGCTETGSLFPSQQGSTPNSTPPLSQSSVHGWLETQSETADQVTEARLPPLKNDGGSIMGATFVGPMQVNLGTGSLPSQETGTSTVRSGSIGCGSHITSARNVTHGSMKVPEQRGQPDWVSLTLSSSAGLIGSNGYIADKR